MPAVPAPACRVVTFTRCTSKCAGAASARARERRSDGLRGVAHDTISMGWLGNEAWLPAWRTCGSGQQNGDKAGESWMRTGAGSCPAGLGSRLEGRCDRCLVFHEGEYDAPIAGRPPGALEGAVVIK